VSQQQTSGPRILSIAAHYPNIRQSDILYTEKEGAIRGLRNQPLVQLKLACIPSQPFYLYGSFHDGQRAYLSFFMRVVNSDLDFQFKLPAFGQDPKVHASLTPPPAHYSHEYISEAKSQWVRSRSLMATDEEFLNLGFVPPTPTRWASGVPMGVREGSDTMQYWNGRKEDFDARINGAGPFSMGNFETDMYGGSKGILPMGHGVPSYTDAEGLAIGTHGPIFWFVFAEYVESKGWRVIHDSRPTFKAGHPYCIVGAMYLPDTGGLGLSEWGPAEDHPAPKFNFLSSAFVNEFGPSGTFDSVIDDWGWGIQSYRMGVNGGHWPTDAYGSLEYTEALKVSVNDLYDDDGAGWFWDSLGEKGEQFSQMLQAEGFPRSSDQVVEKFSVDLEYFDFGNNVWSDTRPSQSCDSQGRFAWYFRTKRQLHPTHPDVKSNPEWALDKTQWAYPNLHYDSGSKIFSVGKNNIGFKQIRTEGMSYNDSPMFNLAVQIDVQTTTMNAKRLVRPAGYAVRIADPDNFAYSTNQQIDRVFFEDGQFAPGKKMVIIGKGLDQTVDIMVSSEKSLAALAKKKGVATPNDLIRQSYIEQYEKMGGGINKQSIGFIKPISVVTAEEFANGIPSGFSDMFENIFGGIPPENLFSAFLDEDVKVAGYNAIELSTLPVDIASPLIDKIAIKYGPLDNRDKNGNTVKQMREKPTHYLLEQDGSTYEFPYTIGVFEIPEGYSGPAPVIGAVLKDGNKKTTLTFAEAKEMIAAALLAEEGSLTNGLSGFSGLGALAAPSDISAAIGEAWATYMDSSLQLSEKFASVSGRGGNVPVYRIYSETHVAPDNQVPSTVTAYWAQGKGKAADITITIETVRGAGEIEATKEFVISGEYTSKGGKTGRSLSVLESRFNRVRPQMTEYFNSEATRLKATTREPEPETTTVETVETLQLNDRFVVLEKVFTTGGWFAQDKTLISYRVTIQDSGRVALSNPEYFSTEAAAKAKMDALTGGKKLVQNLEFVHDTRTPTTVYYRYRNVLGAATTGFEEDLAAELLLQLAKENYGLSKLEQLMTDPVSIGGEEDVSGYDDAEQGGAEAGDNGSGGSGGSAPFFTLKMPKIFRTFKTDNLLRKHTLLPYGSRTPIDEDTTE
tara:strand:- start:5988 stop:9359 length:3372 start_codon:yes stop_codon:yes gene_type:complete